MMSSHWTKLLLLISCLSFYGFQSLPKIDSLKTASQGTHSDSLSITIFNEIAEEFALDYKLMDSSLYYAQKAYDLALEAGEKSGQARAAYNLGYGYDLDGKVNQALQFYEKARQHYAAIDDFEGVATCMHGVGIAYYFQGDYGQALKYYHEAANYARDKKLLEQEANSLLNLGVIYRILENYDKAIELYEENIPIRRALQDSTTLAKVYNNLGVVFTYKEQFDQAAVYLDSSLMIYRALKDSFNLAAVYITLGDLYLEGGMKMQLARDYLVQGYAIMRGYDDNVYQSKALLYLGRVEQKLNNLPRARDYLLEGLKVLADAELVEIERDISLILAEVYEALGNKTDGFFYMQNAYSLNDSINTKERIRLTEEMEAKYESEKQEKEIASLNAEKDMASIKLSSARKRSIILFIALILFGALFLGLYRLYQSNKKQSELIKATLDEKESLLNNLGKAQQRIIQSEKMASLGQLTASIAHEINNPINFISSSAESLQLDFKELSPILSLLSQLNTSNETTSLASIQKLSNELDIPLLQNEIQQLLDGVVEGADRTTSIIKGLKHFSHPGKLEKEPSNIESGLEAVIGLVQTKIKDNISLQKEFSGIPEIMVTKNQLNQVFINILANSIDSLEERYGKTGKGGILKVSTGQTDTEVFVKIMDNGMGIRKAVQSKIFDPFFTTKDIGAGVGLGLSISYGIVEQHQGRIELESKEGEGAEFTIWLPKNPALTNP